MNKFNKKKYIAIISGLLKKKKLKNFLLGKGELEIVCKYADMPTDPGLVYHYLNKYYIETKEEELWIQFEDTLLEMCKDSDSIWLIPYYTISCIRADNKQVDIYKLKKSFQSNIKSFEKQLINNKDWVGAQYQEGLMEAVKRLSKIIKDNYGFDL